VCTICKIRSSGWCEARVPLQLPRHEVPHVGYELEVFETTECSFSLVQPEERTRGGSLIADLFEPCTCIGFVVLSLDSSASAEPCLKEGRPVGLAKMKCREVLASGGPDILGGSSQLERRRGSEGYMCLCQQPPCGDAAAQPVVICG